MSKRLPPGEASFNQTFLLYKKGARNRGHSFDLSKDQFRWITSQGCYYCGDALTNTRRSPRTNGEYKYTGIDRVDNSKGYEIDNCVPCCRVCNKMKSGMGVKDFLVQIEKIYCHFNPVNWSYDEGE